MDQGLAGLIGAVVGITGALGAAYLAGRGQREQWRVQLRRDTYGQFLARTKRAERAGKAVRLAMDSGRFEPGLYATFAAAVAEAEESLALVLLEGPWSVASSAEDVVRHLDGWRWVVELWYDGDGTLTLERALESAGRDEDRFTQELEQFTNEVRRLLHGRDHTLTARLAYRLAARHSA
ncbi:hypothetical protein AB0B78_40125 [Streptomyces sp. NPDC040724]|uniref:hypothetical protein n=1 Tax=Streptomyces sp. NPDC040724 TaxID=3155612 RepID=UPI0034062FD2